MTKLMGRYMVGKNRSGDECRMMWPKLYSETPPAEGVKEGVAVGEGVGFDDGAVVGMDDGAVVGLEDGVVIRATLY
jgi:hypothetical protein